jgi:hypothetical protein
MQNFSAFNCAVGLRIHDQMLCDRRVVDPPAGQPQQQLRLRLYTPGATPPRSFMAPLTNFATERFYRDAVGFKQRLQQQRTRTPGWSPGYENSCIILPRLRLVER